MSEEGSEPDIKPRRFNVAEVPTADVLIAYWLTPAAHATSPVPPAAPVAMAMARMHVNSDSGLLDEAIRLHDACLGGTQG